MCFDGDGVCVCVCVYVNIHHDLALFSIGGNPYVICDINSYGDWPIPR